MRALTASEASNVTALADAGVDFALLEATRTILEKSYFDATIPVRAFLQRAKIHSYDNQAQGQEAKVSRSGYFLDSNGETIRADVTMYRPRTKLGDPRIWFSRLNQLVRSGEIVAMTLLDGHLIAFSLSRQDLRMSGQTNSTWSRILRARVDSRAATVQELLSLMREISYRGFIPAMRGGDTAIGHLLETELGIKANSRKLPDYKGIEIKASRAGRTARSKTLFAKVADWQISPLKSSTQILKEFGYLRNEKFRLNCSVYVGSANSQGLSFELDQADETLNELSSSERFPVVAKWRLATLETELANKHRDTFWVRAETRIVNGIEQMHFIEAKHTSQPVLAQFRPLLETGGLYMDHLISMKPGDTSAHEKGPLFKIKDANFEQLFPAPVVYSL
jgi:hypothetical protein